ncbi:MAG TPA: SPOR domain-containing protein [Saprospiraceae bacterium]|nr:SPOR domain-containing protein [Saprospiraceae bacterium]HMQ82443.1 SPOR domain-containing protein [Saprospiraceae bacterium]
MNLDLIKILIGVGIGIVIVIAIVKAVTPRMGMGGMGMMQGMPMQGGFQNSHYQRQSSGGFMAVTTLAFMFLVLFGIFYVSQQLNEKPDTDWYSYEDEKWQLNSPPNEDTYEYEEEPEVSPPESLPPQERVPESEYDLNVPEAPEEVFKDYNLKVGTPSVNVSPSGRQGNVSVNEVVPYEESPTIPGEFYLQKAAAPTEERAQHEMEKWEDQFPGKVHLGYNNQLDSYAYKVLIGPFRTKEAAQRAAGDRKAYVRNLDEEVHLDVLY